MSDDEVGERLIDPRAWTGLLPWQHDAARAALAGRERWPHALLLTGREGIGKRVLALEFARALLCEAARADGSACGECAGCRYATAFQHPDLRIVEPIEIDDDGVATPAPWITVPHIRALIEWAALTSHRRIAEVAVIAPAERMNAAAANALLKTLEEPPAGTYLILVSHQPGRLPATVRSRCRVMAAPFPEPGAARAWLARQGVGEPDALLAQAGGAPLTAHALDVPATRANARRGSLRSRRRIRWSRSRWRGASTRGRASCARSVWRPPSIGCRRGAPTSRPPVPGTPRAATSITPRRSPRSGERWRPCPSFVIIGRLSGRGRRLRIR
jgi:DNA polymerase III delta' subunit